VTGERSVVEERLAGAVTTLLKMLHPLKAAARTGMPGSGHDRSAALLLFPLMHGPCRPGALAELSHADPSTISRQVAELVRRGLVERQADPSDGRASLLAITDAGRDVCEQVRTMRRELLASAVTGWPEEDLAALAGLLDRFNDALGALYGPPHPRTAQLDTPATDQDTA
jgi:DNA-binding MarR family transcriptional regulator